jgi:exopolyphosphatase / guanosine-5'-triphosphate,3'-diphosphate pyrophosphatase
VTAAAGGRLAVVDVGSNSVRLLLCDGIGPEGPEGARFSTVTALRRGAGADGSLADDALDRLDACLAGYARHVAAFGPARTVVTGTSAVRDAPDRDRVAAVVADRLGAALTVLDGDQEAACSFTGARLGAPGAGEILVVDIGGASTELVRGDRAPGPGVSLQLGAVRQAERHLRDDPPVPAQVAALRDEARGMVADALRAIGGPAPVVGVAGTFTSLAAIELGGYDRDAVHGHELTAATVERIAAELCAMPLERRREVPGLEPGRAPVMPAGALIAAVVLEAAGAGAMRVSERDLLDGVALTALDPSSGVFRS